MGSLDAEYLVCSNKAWVESEAVQCTLCRCDLCRSLNAPKQMKPICLDCVARLPETAS